MKRVVLRRSAPRRPVRHVVVRILGCLALFSLATGLPGAVGATANQAGVPTGTFVNPVFARDFPDPMVLRNGPHDYYAYGTTTSWDIPGHAFPILHSIDLVHWKYVGDAFNSAPSWANGDYWAPDVLAHGGMYYLYYTGLKGSHCVAVATGRSAAGPFTARDVIGCGDAAGSGYIDPAVLIDAGKAYLYVSVDSPDHNISVIPLKPDLLHAAGPRRMLFGLSQKWEYGQQFSTVEGPFPLKHGSLYYVFYSGNDWNGNYEMGYATSRSPLGPFTKCACNPILRGTKDILGPGGGSIVQGPDSQDWLIFHAWDDGGAEGYGSGATRVMMLEPLHWSGSRATVAQPTDSRQRAP